MNKEQLRKELEDCWDASNDSFWWHTVANNDRPEPPDKSTYITIRLAALDDGPDLDAIQKECDKVLTQESVDEYIKEHPELFNKKVDDGQEGNDERKKHEGVARTFRALDVLAEQLHTTKKLLQEYKKEISDGAALLVADRDNSDSTINKTTMINISEDDFKKDLEQIAELSRVYRFDNAETWFKDRKMWIDARLAAYLPSGDIEKNYDPTYESETSQSEKDIKELQKNKTPVADGEGLNEKIKKEFSDNKEALLKAAKGVHKKMKSSAVTGGVRPFVWTDELVEELIWDEYGDAAVRYKVSKFKQSKFEGQPAQKKCPRCKGEGEVEKNIPGNEGVPEQDIMVGCHECGGTGIENS